MSSTPTWRNVNSRRRATWTLQRPQEIQIGVCSSNQPPQRAVRQMVGVVAAAATPTVAAGLLTSRRKHNLPCRRPQVRPPQLRPLPPLGLAMEVAARVATKKTAAKNLSHTAWVLMRESGGRVGDSTWAEQAGATSTSTPSAATNKHGNTIDR